MQKDINEYLEFYKEQSLKEKQKIIVEQLQILAGFTNTLCKELEIPNEVILNQNILNLNNEYSEDEFAEAIIVLINSIQNSVCDYSMGISNLLDKLLQE